MGHEASAWSFMRAQRCTAAATTREEEEGEVPDELAPDDALEEEAAETSYPRAGPRLEAFTNPTLLDALEEGAESLAALQLDC